MNTYKITNITNLTGKRDSRFNSTLDIEYIDSMVKKKIQVKPGETVYLQIASLPISVHTLRVKKLINVVEVGASELRNNMNTSKVGIQIVSKSEAIDEKKAEEITDVEEDIEKKKNSRKQKTSYNSLYIKDE